MFDPYRVGFGFCFLIPWAVAHGYRISSLRDGAVWVSIAAAHGCRISSLCDVTVLGLDCRGWRLPYFIAPRWGGLGTILYLDSQDYLI